MDHLNSTMVLMEYFRDTRGKSSGFFLPSLKVWSFSPLVVGKSDQERIDDLIGADDHAMNVEKKWTVNNFTRKSKKFSGFWLQLFFLYNLGLP